ncbi:hypothetical protein HK097_007415 [Rhizophlyctis rosea]|uniref:Uncharacterized protein n=1 Tax=Rhizophlyctis rosea TaxID=64517 RepID=A0AAD5SIR9_9FUNG|nr:hypothetical protein HK097_007415 [Rhizophlyctis rosea]
MMSSHETIEVPSRTPSPAATSGSNSGDSLLSMSPEPGSYVGPTSLPKPALAFVSTVVKPALAAVENGTYISKESDARELYECTMSLYHKWVEKKVPGVDPETAITVFDHHMRHRKDNGPFFTRSGARDLIKNVLSLHLDSTFTQTEKHKINHNMATPDTIFEGLRAATMARKAVGNEDDPYMISSEGPASNGKTVKLWSAHRTKFQYTLAGHLNWTVKLWDPRSKACVKTCWDDIGIVTSVAFHPSRTVNASASTDRSIKLIDIRTQKLMEHYKDSSPGGSDA